MHLCNRLRLLAPKGEVITLKRSLTFFKMMCALALLLTPAIYCLRHKAYNSPLIIG